MEIMTLEFEKLEMLMKKARSIRRFRQDQEIADSTLERLVGLVRYTPSGRNAQPMKYAIINNPMVCSEIFPHLKWAGYLTDWDGPQEGERPSAYIVQCLDKSIAENPLCDDGIELEALVIGARALGLGTCIIKSFNLREISSILNLPERLIPQYVVAVGLPAEESFIEPVCQSDGSIKYWRDGNGDMHVPKRDMDERII